MAELPLSQAIPRFKSNEDRVDIFVNGSHLEQYLTDQGVAVPSVRKFLADKAAEIDGDISGLLAQSTDAVSVATAKAADAAASAASAAASAAQAAAFDPSGYLTKTGNLAGLADKAAARNNLDLKTVAASGSYTDLSDKPTLGTAAAKDTGTADGNVVAVQTGGKLPALDGSALSNVGVKRGIAVAAANQTAIDFTGIPSTAKRLTLVFDGLSLNGSSNILVQLGSATSIVTTGYRSTNVVPIASANSISGTTVGFGSAQSNSAQALDGCLELYNQSGTVWTATEMGQITLGFLVLSVGRVDLAAQLTRVRVTTVNGTDKFDAGSVNLFWE